MAVEKSGLYYPNRMVRIYLLAVEEMIGAEAMEAVLRQANLPELVANYPPNNISREFDFADFSAIGASLEKMYGMRAERGLGLHAGRASFTEGISQFDIISGLSELALKAIPFHTKLKAGLKIMADTFTRFSDQLSTVEEADDHFIYTIHDCPICWGRTSNHPICYGAIGILQAGLQWFSPDHDAQVEEVACRAMGDEFCLFHIQKEPLTKGEKD